MFDDEDEELLFRLIWSFIWLMINWGFFEWWFLKVGWRMGTWDKFKWDDKIQNKIFKILKWSKRYFNKEDWLFFKILENERNDRKMN